MKLHKQRDNLEKLLDETQEELNNIINWMNHAPKFKVSPDRKEHMKPGVDVHYGVLEAIDRLENIKNNIARIDPATGYPDSEIGEFRIIEDKE